MRLRARTRGQSRKHREKEAESSSITTLGGRNGDLIPFSTGVSLKHPWRVSGTFRPSSVASFPFLLLSEMLHTPLSLRFLGQLRQERKIDSQRSSNLVVYSLPHQCWPPFIHLETALSSSCAPSSVLGLRGCGYSGQALDSHACDITSVFRECTGHKGALLRSYLPLSNNFKTAVRETARY